MKELSPEPKLPSELDDRRGVRPDSTISLRLTIDDIRSLLGLPELTNDRSLSVSVISPSILLGMPLVTLSNDGHDGLRHSIPF